jgi:hypothetical protein
MELMDDALATVAEYSDLAERLAETEFGSQVPHPVLIEKIGFLAQGYLSPLSGTVVVRDITETPRLGDVDILRAKVFALRKKQGSIGVDIFVGRAPTNDIILPNPSVSKSHAHFTPMPGTDRLQVVDMFSSNGTFLNGKKIHPFEKNPVSDYDEIGFGPDYLLIYCSPRAFYQLLKRVKI